MPSINRYFLGVTTRARTDWPLYCALPESDAVKPETRAKHIAEKQEEQARNSSRLQFHAYVESLMVVDCGGNIIMGRTASPDEAPGAVSADFLQMLQTHPAMAVELVDQPAAEDCRVKWFGFDIRENLRIIAADGMYLNVRKPAGPRLVIPAGLWYHRTFEPHPSLDPVDAIVGTTRLKDVGFEQLCKFLAVTVPLDIVDNALSRALLARDLAMRAQMFPTP